MPIRSDLDRPAADKDRCVALSRLSALALLTAVVLPTLLVLHGTVLEGSTASPLGPLAVLSLVPLVIALAAVKPAPRRALSYALVPVAGGLLSIAVAVGAGWFAGEIIWWVPASIVTALPLLALAVITSPRAR